MAAVTSPVLVVPDLNSHSSSKSVQMYVNSSVAKDITDEQVSGWFGLRVGPWAR